MNDFVTAVTFPPTTNHRVLELKPNDSGECPSIPTSKDGLKKVSDIHISLSISPRVEVGRVFGVGETDVGGLRRREEGAAKYKLLIVRSSTRQLAPTTVVFLELPVLHLVPSCYMPLRGPSFLAPRCLRTIINAGPKSPLANDSRFHDSTIP